MCTAKGGDAQANTAILLDLTEQMREYKLRSLRQERELKKTRAENKHLTEQNRELTELVTNLEEETVNAPRNHPGDGGDISQSRHVDVEDNSPQQPHPVAAPEAAGTMGSGGDGHAVRVDAAVSVAKQKLFVTDVDDGNFVARATEQLEKRNELLRAHVQSGADARKEDSEVIQDLVVQVCVYSYTTQYLFFALCLCLHYETQI